MTRMCGLVERLVLRVVAGFGGRVCRLGGLALASGLAVASAGLAASDAGGGIKPPVLEPVLEPLPAVVAVIDALGDNQSAVLTNLNTVGEWNAVTREYNMQRNGPRGRDYTNKAVWMADRRRAFFCGANHGSPHRLNDAWEFDLPSHTWVMLFAPDPHNARGVMEIKEGAIRDGQSNVLETVKYVQTTRGGPTHYGHTWWAFCYHPGMRAALWMNVAIGSGPKKHIEQESGSPDGIYAGPPMWAFDPWTRQWRLVLSPKPYPRIGYAKQMEYVPELGGALFMSASWDGAGVWLYNHQTNAWSKLAEKTNGPDNESLTCLDPARRLIVAQSPVRSTHHYDLATHRWEKVLDPGKESPDAPVGHDARSQMYFDPANRVCLLYAQSNPDGIWVYDPGEKKWTRLKADGPPCPDTRKPISYFDEARGVFVVNVGASTWVYRYRKAAAPAG